MFGPQRARLRLDQPPRGYRADASSVDTNGSYITVDLGNDTVVTGVSTQGYGDTTVQEWVTKYNLMFLNGIDFLPFKETSGATRVRQFIICMPKNFLRFRHLGPLTWLSSNRVNSTDTVEKPFV